MRLNRPQQQQVVAAGHGLLDGSLGLLLASDVGVVRVKNLVS